MKILKPKTPKYKTKKYFWQIFLIIILWLAILQSCVDHRDRLPDELDITELTYELVDQHAFGPSGINQSLRLYELPIETSRKIQDSGLDFLNQLPSAKNYKTNKIREQFYSTEKYWRPFEYWHQTPVPKDERWVRWSYSVSEGDQPTLGEFVGDVRGNSDFMKTIDQRFEDLLHQIIRSPSSYYAYGGFLDKGILILSPEHDKAIYLFRD